MHHIAIQDFHVGQPRWHVENEVRGIFVDFGGEHATTITVKRSQV